MSGGRVARGATTRRMAKLVATSTAVGLCWFTKPASASPDEALRCLHSDPSYYAIDLITTKNIPGTGLAKGTATVTLPESSPFAVALAADGSYEYRVDVSLKRAKTPRSGHLVAWVTTPDLELVARLGTLDSDFRTSGLVRWNKFIVVITHEAEDDQAAQRWSGPVAFRGMSKSGAMHTMVGHGALQQENCAAWGY